MSKIAVMGAGAVGCYYGARLAQAGHSVTMIGRRGHVAAMRERGLILETATGTEPVRVEASEEPAGIASADLVLVSVKSNDVDATGRGIAPYLDAGAQVVSLQNGVDTAERLEQAIGRPVIPSAVYVAVEMTGPGHVRHHGRGELVIGSGPSSSAVAMLLREAGIPTEVSDNVVGVLWAKLIVNCAYNALSAIPHLPYGHLVAVAGVPEVMDDVVAECLQVAARAGVTLPGDVPAAVRGLAASMPSQFSSTAQDLARGKTSEIDHLNGYVVRKAAELGIAAPANRALWVMVKLMEARRG
ncbi:ketopantoate reductase family protein [Enterovirga sp. CN4-39]|uniref:ketopantoate reductase family protein n=1 Tax=Enterovirga sp. CN4-39 TaxID=3400910 RepID=UPI003C07D14B